MICCNDINYDKNTQSTFNINDEFSLEKTQLTLVNEVALEK